MKSLIIPYIIERFTVVGSQSIQVNKEPIMQIPRLSREFRIQLQFRIKKVDSNLKLNFIFEIISENKEALVGFQVKEGSNYFKSKRHFLQFGFTKKVPKKNRYETWFYMDNRPLLVGKPNYNI